MSGTGTLRKISFMRGNEIVLPPFLYYEHFETISNVKFSFREIDILACVLNGRSVKGIAHFLSISPHTVETHIRNIMRKIECGSRDGVITFIEDSGKFSILKHYYACLLISSFFKHSLSEIAKLKPLGGPNCLIVYWRENKNNQALLKQLKVQLKCAGVKISIEEREEQLSTS